MLSYDLRNALIKSIEEKGYFRSELVGENSKYDITKNTKDVSFNENYEAILFTMVYSLIDYIYYDKGIVVTAMNSNPVYLKKDIYRNLKIIIENYINNKKLEYILYVGFLMEFVLLYNVSLRNHIYLNNPDYDKICDDFFDLFSKEYIYRDMCTEFIQYYDWIFENIIDEKSKIDDEFLYRFFGVINKYNIDKSKARGYIEIILNKTIFLDVVIENVESDLLELVIDSVNQYLIDNMNRGNGRDIELLMKLKNKTDILSKIQKGFINSLIRRTNQLLTSNNSQGVIMDIHNVDALLTDLNNLKQVVDSTHKVKLNECQQKILYLKRVFVSDEKEVNKNMHKFEYEIPYDKDLVERTKKALMKNPFNVYSITRVDYHNVLEKALINKSKYAISYLVSEIDIDSKNGVYQYVKESDDTYSKYFDEVGKEIQNRIYREDLKRKREDKVLLNHNDKGFYDAMLKDLRYTYSFTFQSLYYIINMKEYTDLCKERLNDLFGTDNFTDDLYDDLSFFLPELLLAVERRLLSIYNSKSNEGLSRIDESKYLADLFEVVDSITVKNDIYYLYYLLYCKRGFDLRNKMFHGHMQIGNYYMYTFLLMACFTCLYKIEEYLNV